MSRNDESVGMWIQSEVLGVALDGLSHATASQCHSVMWTGVMQGGLGMEARNGDPLTASTR